MFCKQFLAYAVHIDWCYHSIHKHFQVGLNMHLYDEVGDASSSLRGSTSSFLGKIIHDFLTVINKWLKGNIV